MDQLVCRGYPRGRASSRDRNVSTPVERNSAVFRFPDSMNLGQVQTRPSSYTTAYAIATLAAVGFAGILVFIMRSDEVRGFLLNLIRTALALP